MADVERTIQIIFGATDATGQVFGTIGSDLKSLSDSATSISQPLADVTDTLLTTTAGIGALAAAAIGFSVNEGRKFEDSLLELQKVLGDEVAADFSSQIFDLSNQFGVSAQDVTAAAARFKQAGFDIETSFELVETSLTAAVASELEAAEAADLLVRSIKGLGEATIPAAILFDKFNAVQNNFNVSVGQIAEGFADFSPLIQGFGLTIDDSIGLLTTLIEVFGSGSEAARALRSGFLALTKDTATTATRLGELGISQRAANGELKTGEQILQELAVALSDKSDADRQAALSTLVGSQNAAQFALILGNLETVQRASTVASESQGSALDELGFAMESLTTKTAKTQVAFQNFAIQFGSQLLPQSKEVIDSLGEIGRALSESLDAGALDPLISAIQGRFGDLSQLFSGIADALPQALEGVDFGPIINGFDAIADALNNLFGGLDLTSVNGLQNAIQFVIDTIGSLEQVVGGVIDAFKPFISGVVALVDGFNDLDDGAKESAGNVLGFGKAVNSIAPAFSALGNGLSVVGAGLTTIGAANLLKITADLGKASASAKGLGTTLAAAAKAIGPLGVGLGAGLGVGTLIDQIPVVRDFVDSLIGPRGVEEAARLASESTSLLESQVSRLRDRTGDLTINTDNYFQKLDSYVKRQGEAQTATSAFGDSVKQAAETLSDVTLSGEFKIGEPGVDLFKGTLDQLNEVQGKLVETGEVAKNTDVTPSLSPEKIADLNLELDKLAQQERIARIKAFVDVSTANAEAAASIIEAAFESVNTSVESTGDTLVGLFDAALKSAEQAATALAETGLFGEGGLDSRNQEQLTEAIRNEVEARKKALEIARELQQVELDIAKQRAQRLAQGISEITINADGVEPALRAFMLVILQEIQIQASADGAEFLLGIS